MSNSRYTVMPKLSVVELKLAERVQRAVGLIPHWADDKKIGHKLFNVGSTIDLTHGFICP